VAEAIARDVIVADLDHKLGPKRFPLARALRAPTAGPARCIASQVHRQ
jgi:hypothetical protein